MSGLVSARIDDLIAVMVDEYGGTASFSRVTGRGDVVGAELVRNPDVAELVHGSVAFGKSIRDGAATMKRVTLELGGKSPNILLDDADLT